MTILAKFIRFRHRARVPVVAAYQAYPSTLYHEVDTRCAHSYQVMERLHKFQPPAWATKLKSLPQHRLQLGHLNTPIHEWKLPGIPDGFQVSIKRDDMTGSTLSGNKVRKLEFLLAEAVQRGCKHVITCGGLQSNHCRATAIAARQLGMTPHLFLRTDESAADIGATGNVFLNRLCGSQIQLIPLRSPQVTHIWPKMQQLAQQIKSSSGEDSYQICVGGSDSVGLFGYIHAFQELLEQGIAERCDDIVVACGSGGTMEGLAIGNYLSGAGLRVHGVIVSDNAAAFREHLTDTFADIGLDGVKPDDIVNLVEGHKCLGYGISTQQELDLSVEIGQQTGILLDPVYTTKTVKGLIHEINHNPHIFQGRRILYIHTGGIFGLYDERINETLIAKNKENNDVRIYKDSTKDDS